MLSTDAIKVTKRISLLITVNSIIRKFVIFFFFFTYYDTTEILKNNLSYNNILVYKNLIYLVQNYNLV